jgi:CcmD family protein
MTSLLALAPAALLFAEPGGPATSLATAGTSDVSGGPGWLVAVNLVIWTGLFLYLLRLERRLVDTGAGKGGSR